MREKQIEGMIEAIKKCSCVYTDCEQECSQCSNEELYDDTINHIARTIYDAGYRKQEWISVDERLPERQGYYLGCTYKGLMMIAPFFPVYADDKPEFRYDISHWMPLPEAPKMKGGAE
jgi:hypothetical protein